MYILKRIEYILKRIEFGKPWDPFDIKEISSVLRLEKTDIINSEKMDELIHFKDRFDNNALIMGSKHADVSVVNFSLSKGSNVLDKNMDGRSSLIEASMCLDLRSIYVVLMPPNRKFIEKNHIKRNYIKIIKILLLHGANINDTDSYGNTAMTYAFNEGHTEIVEILQKWPLTMLFIVLQELNVYNELDWKSFSDFNEYY